MTVKKVKLVVYGILALGIIGCIMVGFVLGFVFGKPQTDFDMIVILRTDSNLFDDYKIDGYRFTEHGVIVTIGTDNIFVSDGMYLLDNYNNREERMLNENHIG